MGASSKGRCIPVMLNNGEIVYAYRSAMDLLRKKLIEKATKLGHLPSKEEVRSDPEMPKIEDYEFCWGAYSKAVTAVYWEWMLVTGNVKRNFASNEENIAKIKEDLETRKKDVKKIDQRGEDKMMKRYSDDELLALLKLKKGKLDGKNPTIADMNDDPEMPNINTYIRRFGSWAKALDLVKGVFIVDGPKEDEEAVETSEDEVTSEEVKKEDDAYSQMTIEELLEVPELPPIPEVKEPKRDVEQKIVVQPDGNGKVEIKLQVGNVKLSITISQ